MRVTHASSMAFFVLEGAVKNLSMGSGGLRYVGRLPGDVGARDSVLIPLQPAKKSVRRQLSRPAIANRRRIDRESRRKAAAKRSHIGRLSLIKPRGCQ